MDTNSQCHFCRERFSSSYKPIAVFTRCGHVLHTTYPCYNSYCSICEDYGGHPVPIKNFEKNKQDYINGLSITREKINFNIVDRVRGLWRLLISLPYISSLIFRLYFKLVNKEYLHWLNKYLIKTLNINVMCSDESLSLLLNSSYKRVLIANHTNYHDALVIGSLLSPENNFGFVASPIINTNLFGKAITEVVPNIIISDNKNESNFDKIAKYFKKYPKESRLLIFPEGMLTHSLTIGKFRSTAFKLGFPVQPIILKYYQNIFDLLNFDIWCYKKIDVEVKVLKPINTLGSYNSIENIRKLMAKEGEMQLSNVSNRKIE